MLKSPATTAPSVPEPVPSAPEPEPEPERPEPLEGERSLRIHRREATGPRGIARVEKWPSGVVKWMGQRHSLYVR